MYGCIQLQPPRKRANKNRTYRREKIATVLEIPLENIYESDESMMFVYNDQSSGNSGNHFYSVPQYLLDTQKKYLEQLEVENQALKDKIKLLAGE